METAVIRMFRFLKAIVFVIIFLSANSYARSADRAVPLEGFNWYSEKKEVDKPKTNKLPVPKSQEKAEELPEYEKNIRSLQARHRAAHRRALDNPTAENLLIELRLEKEMMNKSKIYGERRVAVTLLDSRLNNMKNHSNVLHRQVQEQIKSKEIEEKLSTLSEKWGLVLQVQEGCEHCHAFAPIVFEFAGNYAFQLLAATKDGKDFEEIEGVEDKGEMAVFNPNRETPILYLVKYDGSEVFPISRGINSEEQIINNIMMIDKHLKRLF